MSILTTHTNLVSAMFTNLDQAEKVVADLHRAGVPSEEISVFSRQASRAARTRPEIQGLYLEEEHSPTEEGAETGATIGGVGGFLAGLTVVSLPGVGPFLVLGTALVSAIAGMSVGALAGGAVGVLIELGYRKELAERISQSLERGHVLVAAQAETVGADKIRELMQRHEPRELLEKHAVGSNS